MDWILLILLILIVLCEVVAQCYTQIFSTSNKLVMYLVAVLFYAAVVYFLAESHKHTNMGIANCIWSGLSIIAIALAGSVFFGQSLTTAQWVALVATGASVGYLTSTIEKRPI